MKQDRSLLLAVLIFLVAAVEVPLIPAFLKATRLGDAPAVGLILLVNVPLLYLGFRSAIRDVNHGCSSSRAAVVCLLLMLASAPTFIFCLLLLIQAGGKN
jgi:hypothetical protein